MKTLKEDRQEQTVRNQHSENLATYHDWIKTHPSIRDCTATFNAFVEYMEGEDVWTEADLDYALSQIPEGRLVTQRVPSEAEVVAEENARRKSMTLSELKTLARLETPAPTAPTLPMEITLPGRKTPTDISTAAALKALANTNMWAFKWLFNKYGSELLNARLGVKPKTQTGVSVRLPL